MRPPYATIRETLLFASAAALLAFAAAAPAATHDDDDTCLLLLASNLSNPGGNYYLYHVISDRDITIREGDRLKYELFLATINPSLKGGIDILCTDGTSLRDSGATDGAGLRAHGDAVLAQAAGQWLTRTIDLSALKDKVTRHVDVQFEGDEKGEYVQFIDNITIEHADGSHDVVYDNGQPKVNRVDWRNGYSEHCLCTPVDRSKVKPGEALDRLIAERKAKQALHDARSALRTETDLATRFAKAEKRDDIVQELKSAMEGVPDPEEFQGTAAEYHEILHKQRSHLDHAHPLMKKFSGQLVGHAHIDLQWLWEWPEGLDCSRSTFEQACKFMEEYPDFTFSQSSAGLYQKIEEQYPELFELIRKRVSQGRFEFVGGRWCEGDTNMISPESHARHLLYGQRYFKKAFGKVATVGWEPDTFGHTIQMPQIMKLGGIDSYYFCRGGKNVPLFWWESPDGTRMLTFDEPASGSWYNSDIVDSNVEELLSFYEKTGLKDLIWVYGVGNHGGGPTREMIEKANSWKDAQGRPTVQFGTARKFFDLCKQKNLEKLPVVKDELNPVFRGCYTTHGDMKKLNHDAEAALVAAEAVAFMASQSGYPYPAADFERAWRDVCWNHHHDTLPGSGIHDSYELSHVQLTHAIEMARWIQESAARHLAYRVADEGEGEGILVINPLGWERDAFVRVEITHRDKGMPLVVDAAGNRVQPEWVRGGTPAPPSTELEYRHQPSLDTISFVARGLPSYGYQSWRVVWSEDPAPAPDEFAVKESATSVTFENQHLLAMIDRSTGRITSVVRKSDKKESLTGGRAGNRIEAHMEEPHGMSAWQTGKIVEVKPAVPSSKEPVITRTRTAVTFSKELQFGNSTITTVVSLRSGSRSVDFETTIDWREAGSHEKPSPMIRVAFPVGEAPATGTGQNETKPDYTFRCGVPFGDLARPADGEDVAAIQWASVLGPTGGAALLNDCKHGYSCNSKGELFLTLVRASYEPDPRPDQYTQVIRYSLLPLDAGSKPSESTRAAMEWNIPAVAQRVLHNHHNGFAGDRRGDILPASKSFVEFDGLGGAVPTALKRSEDGRDLVVRYYQADPEPASGNVIAGIAAQSVATVNFLEDTLGEPQPIVTPRPGPAAASPRAQSPVKLRPYEIQTLKFKSSN